MATDSLILSAARFANSAHAGQVRKYTGQPYITHPARVASRVMLLPEASETEVAAAWLHDVLEDCDVSKGELADLFGFRVVTLVVELTNTSRDRSLSRSERKKLDRGRLACCSRWARRIKVIDRHDNIAELNTNDWPDGFAAIYMYETAKLFEALLDSFNVSNREHPDNVGIDLVRQAMPEMRRLAKRVCELAGDEFRSLLVDGCPAIFQPGIE